MGNGAPDRVNIPCIMHDTRLCQIDYKMKNNLHGTKMIYRYTTYYDVKQDTCQVKRPDTRKFYRYLLCVKNQLMLTLCMEN